MQQMQIKQPATVFTNGVLAVGTDLVFKFVVLSEEGWLPLEGLDLDDLKTIKQASLGGTTIPAEFKEHLQLAISAAETAAAS